MGWVGKSKFINGLIPAASGAFVCWHPRLLLEGTSVVLLSMSRSFLPSFEMGLLIKAFLEELSPNGQVIPFDIYTTFDQKDARSYNCHRTNWYQGRDPFNQNSDRSDREKWTTSKGWPVFPKLFRLDRTDPLSCGPKFPEILVEWIASKDHVERWTSFFETFPVGPNRSFEFWTEIFGNFSWMDRAPGVTPHLPLVLREKPWGRGKKRHHGLLTSLMTVMWLSYFLQQANRLLLQWWITI